MVAVCYHLRMKRFFDKVDTSGDCWEWTGAKRPTGYGNFYYGGRVMGAYRASYLINVGEIPDGFEVDHLCRNRGCVNPAHLEAVDKKTNMHRSDSFSGVNARKTHCLNGHEFSQENTRIKSGSKRSCRTCERERLRVYRSRGKCVNV